MISDGYKLKITRMRDAFLYTIIHLGFQSPVNVELLLSISFRPTTFGRSHNYTISIDKLLQILNNCQYFN